MKEQTELKNNIQKGQILLFVVIAMSIALAIGVAISARTLSSLQRTTRTDTASKVYSGAEGGAEAFISLPDIELEKFLDNLNSSEHAEVCSQLNSDWQPFTDENNKLGCSISYIDPATNVTTRADVSVDSFDTNDTINGSDAYTFELANGASHEVILRRENKEYQGALTVCWTTGSVDLQYILYNEDGVRAKKFIVGDETNAGSRYDNLMAGEADTINEGIGEASYESSLDYDYCYLIENAQFNPYNGVRPYGLRIRALYGGTSVAVIPSNSGNFPNQGFLITSKAELITEGITKSVRTVRVYKTLAFLPGVFDYAIYSELPITQ